jgi:hypothetical protein
VGDPARAPGRRARPASPRSRWGGGLSAGGAALAIAAAQLGTFAALLVAFVLMGAGNAASFQSRFAATDLSQAASAGRSLAVVVWATTIGAVAGPNLTGPGADLARAVGVPDLAGPFCSPRAPRRSRP